MKKTIFTLMILAGCATAAPAEPMTITPLSSTDHWETSYKVYSQATPAINTESQSITATNPDNAGWGQGSAFYTLEQSIELLKTTDTLSFSFNLTQTNQNSLASIAFVGDTQAIVLGVHYNWESVQYGLISKGTDDGWNKTYGPGASAWPNYYAANNEYGFREDLVAIDLTSPITISGDIAYSGGQYVLSLTAGDTVKTLNLGSAVQLNQISIALDGPSGSFPGISALTVSSTPEPATFTLSILALTGLAARRRRH